jgi:hypothetical protein
MTVGHQHAMTILGVPVSLFLLSFLGRTLARGSSRPSWEDVYQGPDAMLATITGLIFYIVDLGDADQVPGAVLKSVAFFLLLAVVLFLGSVALQRAPFEGRWRVFWLGFVSARRRAARRCLPQCAGEDREWKRKPEARVRPYCRVIAWPTSYSSRSGSWSSSSA